MSAAGLLDRAFAAMDKTTGMFPEGWGCRRCGKKLNADGSHPAELYAGTYNGLCYPCTSEAGYVAQVLEDGCQLWSYPPHCPSWRRDRESAFGYPDCEECKGSGRIRSGSWTSVPQHCTDCLARHCKRGKYDLRDVFSREDLSREEKERRAYIEAVGHEPPEPQDDPQWRYKGTPKERKALKEELAA